MKLREMLQKNRIEIGAELCSKDEVLKRLSALQSDDDPQNTALLTNEIEVREKLGSSAVSGRVAIPCVRHSGAEDTRISVVTLKSGGIRRARQARGQACLSDRRQGQERRRDRGQILPDAPVDGFGIHRPTLFGKKRGRVLGTV